MLGALSDDMVAAKQLLGVAEIMGQQLIAQMRLIEVAASLGKLGD